MTEKSDFFSVVNEAVDDMSKYGFDNIDRVTMWERRIRDAADKAAMPDSVMLNKLKRSYGKIYKRLVSKSGAIRRHKGVPRFTIDKLNPKLRAELDRRIIASANLIKINRREAINKTLQRFSGLSTSIPKGGSKTSNKSEAKQDIKKALSSLPFEERRVLIDQGHKLNASLNDVIAKDGGALAIIWNSHWKEPNYDYRPDHKRRDKKVFAIRPNWALDKGLMKPGKVGYYDQVTALAEEPFCRCYGEYVYNLGSLPPEMLTKKGIEALESIRG